MKNTLLLAITFILLLPTVANANLGIDREEHYEKARIITCWTIYYENSYQYREANPYHNVMCQQVFDKIRELQWRNLTNFLNK